MKKIEVNKRWTHQELCRSRLPLHSEAEGKLHLPSTAGGTLAPQRTLPPSRPDLRTRGDVSETVTTRTPEQFECLPLQEKVQQC